MKTRFLFPLFGFQHRPFMEGETTSETDSSEDPNDPGESSSSTGKIPAELQPEVDRIVQKRLAKEKKQNQDLAAKLKTLQNSSSLTKQERDDLASQIDTLESSLQTEQERSQSEQKKLQAKYEKDTTALSGERDLWKTRFHSSTIARALTDAAVEAGAEHPQQISMMFGGNTRLVQDQGEDGKPLESFTAMLSFTGLAEDGKTREQMELPVTKAILKIKEDGLNKNLFKHASTPGTGTPPSGGSGGSGGKKFNKNTPPSPDDYSSVSEWQTDYDAWRKEHRGSSVGSY